MNFTNDARWSLWTMAAHGLGDSRSGTGGQRGSTDSSSKSRGDGSGGRSSGGRSSGGGIGPEGSGAGDPSGGRGGDSSSSSGSSSGKSSRNGSSSNSSASSSSRSGSRETGGNSSSRSSGSSSRGNVSGGGYNGSSVGRQSSSNSRDSRDTGSSSSSRSSPGTGRGRGSISGGGYSGSSVGRQSSSNSRNSRDTGSEKASLSRAQESNLAGRLSGAVSASTGRGLSSNDGGKAGRVGSGLGRGNTPGGGYGGSSVGRQSANTGSRASSTTTAPGRTRRVGGGLGGSLSPAQEANLSERLGPADTAGGKTSRVGTPSVRSAEDRSMTALRATAKPTTGRAAEDSSMRALRGAQVTRPSVRAAEDQSMTALRAAAPPRTGRAAEDSSMRIHGAYQRALKGARDVESTVHGYKSVGFTSSYPKRSRDDYPAMSLREVADWQETQDKSKGKGYKADRTYVGAYQLGRSQIRETAKRLGLDMDRTTFTDAMQDYIAQDRMQFRADRATRNGVLDTDRFANELAREWAGLANASGKTHYAGRAGNKAGNTYADTRSIAGDLISSGAVTPRGQGRTGPVSDVQVASLPDAGIAYAPTPTPAPRGAGAAIEAELAKPSDRFGSTYLATTLGRSPSGPVATTLGRSPSGPVATTLGRSPSGPVANLPASRVSQMAPGKTGRLDRDLPPDVRDRFAPAPMTDRQITALTPGLPAASATIAGTPPSMRFSETYLGAPVTTAPGKTGRIDRDLPQAVRDRFSPAPLSDRAITASVPGLPAASAQIAGTPPNIPTPVTTAPGRTDRIVRDVPPEVRDRMDVSVAQNPANTVAPGKTGRVDIAPALERFGAAPTPAVSVDSLRTGLQPTLDRFGDFSTPTPPADSLRTAAPVQDQAPLSPFAGPVGSARSLDKPVAMTQARADAFPNYDGVTRATIDFSGMRGKKRSEMPNDDVLDLTSIAVAAGAPGYSFVATSGKGSTGKNEKANHPEGFAVDGMLVDDKGKTVSYKDAPEAYHAVARAAAAFGAHGVGVYSSSGHMHVDLTPGLSGRAWGQNGSQTGLTADASAAINDGYAISNGMSASRSVAETPAVAESPRHVGPAPSVREAAPARRTGLAPRPTNAPRQTVGKPTQTPTERSLPDKVLAGAIDAGVSMIPGVGQIAGAYGLAAGVLGLPTIGDAALAFRDTNQFDLKESLKDFDPNAGGSGDDRPIRLQGAFTNSEGNAGNAKSAARFEEKYLSTFVDNTSRPTPEQRWGSMGSTRDGSYIPAG